MSIFYGDISNVNPTIRDFTKTALFLLQCHQNDDNDKVIIEARK